MAGYWQFPVTYFLSGKSVVRKLIGHEYVSAFDWKSRPHSFDTSLSRALYTPLLRASLRERAGAYDGSVGRRRAVEIKLVL